MSFSKITAGRRALLERCRNGFSAASRQCGVPAETLRHHALGDHVPTEAARLAYERTFGIPVSSWPRVQRGRPSKRLEALLAELDAEAP